MPTSTAVAAAATAPSAETLRAVFETPSAPTIGLEEELMLLHPETLDLLPRVPELLVRAAADDRFRGEMPAAQVEIAVTPAASVAAGARSLREARTELASLTGDLGLLTAIGTHPFTDPLGTLTPAEPRYEAMLDEFADAARLQLCFGLHVHVAVRPAHRAVRVHDAMRSYLPLLAALSANSPYLGGRDTGLATVRPQLAQTLPRQGIPPALGTVEGWASALAWGERGGALPRGTRWWWEMRLHPLHGTLEVRVCDAQPTVGEVAALSAVVQCLVADLAARDEGGEVLPVHDHWRIATNRWSACRHGSDATFIDLDTGEPEPGRAVLHDLLERLGPTAAALGCTAELADAVAMIDDPPSGQLRTLVADEGQQGAMRRLAARFLA